MITYLWWALGAVLLLGLIAFLIAFQHIPFRKWVMRKVDPSWRRRGQIQSFPPELVREEAKQLFVCSTVMRDACDIIWEDYLPHPPADLTGPHPDGTVVWVNTSLIPRFIEEFLPQMQYKFVLVSGRQNNPTRLFDIDRALADDNLLHWYVENYEFPAHYIDTGRISPLPLGINYHKLDPASKLRTSDWGTPAVPAAQQLQLKLIRDEIAPIRERPLKVYCNFQLNMDTFLRHPHAIPRAEARAEAIGVLRDRPFSIIEPNHATRNEVWRRHKEAAFEASPRGNSIDCHRTWEALLLRTIPIVKTTLMDPVYDGLPVAIVQDWSEVTETRMQQWVEEFAPWFDRPLPPELYSDHWIGLMHGWKEQTARAQLSSHAG